MIKVITEQDHHGYWWCYCERNGKSYRISESVSKIEWAQKEMLEILYRNGIYSFDFLPPKYHI